MLQNFILIHNLFQQNVNGWDLRAGMVQNTFTKYLI